jgi:hypothetical protein
MTASPPPASPRRAGAPRTATRRPSSRICRDSRGRRSSSKRHFSTSIVTGERGVGTPSSSPLQRRLCGTFTPRPNTPARSKAQCWRRRAAAVTAPRSALLYVSSDEVCLDRVRAPAPRPIADLRCSTKLQPQRAHQRVPGHTCSPAAFGSGFPAQAASSQVLSEACFIAFVAF